MNTREYKEIRRINKFYDDWIAEWQTVLDEQIRKLNFKIWATDTFKTYPDAGALADIKLTSELAKKRISSLEKRKQERIKIVLEDRELEYDIGQVFGS